MVYREASRACPACKGTLKELEYGRYVLERCGVCSGVWVPTAVIHAMVAERQNRLLRLKGAPEGPVRLCPDCGTRMLQVNPADDARWMTLDQCPFHGFWFDPAELERVLQGRPSRGGVDDVAHRVLDAVLDFLGI